MEGIARPGDMMPGPVLLATADMASYALTLVLRQFEDALTSDLLINFFRLALADSPAAPPKGNSRA